MSFAYNGPSVHFESRQLWQLESATANAAGTVRGLALHTTGFGRRFWNVAAGERGRDGVGSATNGTITSSITEPIHGSHSQVAGCGEPAPADHSARAIPM